MLQAKTRSGRLSGAGITRLREEIAFFSNERLALTVDLFFYRQADLILHGNGILPLAEEILQELEAEEQHRATRTKGGS